VRFRLNEDWALITRTKLPGIVEPPKKHGEHWTTGLGNGHTTFFLSPEHGEDLYWLAPLGVHRGGSGPSLAVVRHHGEPWVTGAVVNNIWSFGDDSNNANRTNSFLLNPFVSYHFADGWSVGSSPNITADWIARGGKWTVPVGGGMAKLLRVGEQPVKLAIDAYYNAIRKRPATIRG